MICFRGFGALGGIQMVEQTLNRSMKVRRHLGVSLAQIYLARHRVGKLLKEEIEYLKAQER